MTNRPAPRKSGRAPKQAEPDALDVITLAALRNTIFLQNSRRRHGLKSRHLSRIATDLELAFIEKRPRELTDQLCLDIAATALRILEQGDGH